VLIGAALVSSIIRRRNEQAKELTAA
jgi:hypothetical protein